MKEFKIIKNDFYEIYFPLEYEEYIKEVLDYSTNRLIDNLHFFNEDSYGDVIKASFFDEKEDFFNRICEIDSNANPPEWAMGCFYGGENQILLEKDNVRRRFYTLAHETCHLLFSRFIYKNYSDRVVWLDEAFAANFSGEVEEELENGVFKEKLEKYINRNDLPKMSEISFKNNNVKTDSYNGYDFFHIVGRYLVEMYDSKELLELFNDESKVLELGTHILEDSIKYFSR